MNINNTSIILSGHRAILGAITSNIRAIQVTYDENSILLHYFYFIEPKEYEISLGSDVAAEIASDFPGIVSIDVISEVLPISTEIPKNRITLYRAYEGQVY